MKVKIKRKDLNKYFHSEGVHMRLKGTKEIIIEGEPVEGFVIKELGRLPIPDSFFGNSVIIIRDKLNELIREHKKKK